MKNYPLYEHPNFTDLKQLITMQADRIPNQTAFEYLKQGKIEKISYAQFYHDIEAFVAFLYQQGLQNMKIAVIGENSYEWLLTYFAAVLSSNIIVPLDKELPDGEIGDLLSHCGAQVIVYSDSYTDVAKEMLQSHKAAKIYNMKHFPMFLADGKKLIDSGFYNFQQNKIDENRVCSIIFTSGTTGVSKGVMLTQKNLMIDAVSACKNIRFTGPSLLILPLHHTFAFTAGILMMLIYGLPVCISKGLRTFNNDMKVFQPHHMFLVPLFIETIYQSIWKSAQEQGKAKRLKIMIVFSNLMRNTGIDLRKNLFHSILKQFGSNLNMIVSGGAPIEQKYIAGMEDIGIQVFNGYGITECSPVVAVNRNKYFRKNSVGLPLSCCEVKIMDGEICVKGGNVMQGYYHNEAATSEVLKDGWLQTGDMGYLDEDGFLYITGRKKNLIILSNGENVSAEELEKKLQGMDSIQEVIVYVENGEITAEIYAGNKAGIKEDIAKLNKELPAYKRIQKVKFRSTEFEKTTTKKIKRSMQNEKIVGGNIENV